MIDSCLKILSFLLKVLLAFVCIVGAAMAVDKKENDNDLQTSAGTLIGAYGGIGGLGLGYGGVYGAGFYGAGLGYGAAGLPGYGLGYGAGLYGVGGYGVGGLYGRPFGGLGYGIW